MGKTQQSVHFAKIDILELSKSTIFGQQFRKLLYYDSVETIPGSVNIPKWLRYQRISPLLAILEELQKVKNPMWFDLTWPKMSCTNWTMATKRWWEGKKGTTKSWPIPKVSPVTLLHLLKCLFCPDRVKNSRKMNLIIWNGIWKLVGLYWSFWAKVGRKGM